MSEELLSDGFSSPTLQPPRTTGLPPFNDDSLTTVVGEGSSSSSRPPLKRAYEFDGITEFNNETKHGNKTWLNIMQLSEERIEIEEQKAHIKQIEKDVSYNTRKEELWAQICGENGMQMFDKYWEEDKKHKNELITAIEKLVFPQ